MRYNIVLLRTAAIYGLIGAFMGSHMAGGGGYELRPIHAHILVAGWLSLFAFSMYYRLYAVPKTSKLAFLHTWSSVIGSLGLTIGMWFYNVNPLGLNETFTTVFYIAGGSLVLLSYALFAVMTFKYTENKE